MRSLRIAAIAACVVVATVAAASTAAPGLPATLTATCATSMKLGFGLFTEKNPPTATHELRGVVYTKCGRPPRGTCVADSYQDSRHTGTSRVPVIATGRCRFILRLPSNFAQATIRVRFLPAAGFGPSSATIVAAPNRLTPFPPDRGQTAPSGGGGVAPAPKGTRIVGFAFVDSRVTSLGARAKLPTGAKIYPSGSTVTGTAGCPTDQYGQTGLLAAVFDYAGPPIAGQLTVTLGGYAYAPIPMDVDQGRRVQFLGQPLARNGTYAITLELLGAKPKTLTARLTLARSC